MVCVVAVVAFWVARHKDARFRPRGGEVLLALLMGTLVASVLSWSFTFVFQDPTRYDGGEREFHPTPPPEAYPDEDSLE